MPSSRIEPDEAATLMMAMCKELKVKHRLVFTGTELPGAYHVMYMVQFQVAEACDKSGWITIKDVKALVEWLAQKR